MAPSPSAKAVSYTHLDVYKRQDRNLPADRPAQAELRSWQDGSFLLHSPRFLSYPKSAVIIARFLVYFNALRQLTFALWHDNFLDKIDTDVYKRQI